MLLCFNENSGMISIQISRNWIFPLSCCLLAWKDWFFLSFLSPLWCILLPKKTRTNKRKKKGYQKIYQIFLWKENCFKTNWWFPLYFLLEIKSSCLIWCSCKILKIYVFLIKMDYMYEMTERWQILFLLCLKNRTYKHLVNLSSLCLYA